MTEGTASGMRRGRATHGVGSLVGGVDAGGEFEGWRRRAGCHAAARAGVMQGMQAGGRRKIGGGIGAARLWRRRAGDGGFVVGQVFRIGHAAEGRFESRGVRGHLGQVGEVDVFG